MRSPALLLGLLLAMAPIAPAQSDEDSDAELKAKLEEKLKKPFASNVAWIQRFDEAKKLAAEKGKVIFAYFSRSYAP